MFRAYDMYQHATPCSIQHATHHRSSRRKECSHYNDIILCCGIRLYYVNILSSLYIRTIIWSLYYIPILLHYTIILLQYHITVLLCYYDHPDAHHATQPCHRATMPRTMPHHATACSIGMPRTMAPVAEKSARDTVTLLCYRVWLNYYVNRFSSWYMSYALNTISSDCYITILFYNYNIIQYYGTVALLWPPLIRTSSMY